MDRCKTDGAWSRHVSSKCSKNDGGSMEEWKASL